MSLDINWFAHYTITAKLLKQMEIGTFFSQSVFSGTLPKGSVWSVWIVSDTYNTSYILMLYKCLGDRIAL